MSIQSQSSIGSRLGNEDYANFHTLRKSLSTMDQLQEKKFESIFQEQCGFLKGKKIRVLSIGSGTGDFDKQIIIIMTRLGLQIKQYVCIEPIDEHISILQKNLLSVLNDDQFSIHNMRSKDFSTSKKFHIIHNVHVIHWISKPLELIVQMQSLLKTNGKSITVLQSQNGVPRLYEKLLSANNNLYGCLTAEKLYEDMKKNGFSNYTLEYIQAELNVSEIHKKSEQGKNLLKFLISQPLNNIEFEKAISVVKEISIETPLGEYIIQEPFAFITNTNNKFC